MTITMKKYLFLIVLILFQNSAFAKSNFSKSYKLAKLIDIDRQIYYTTSFRTSNSTFSTSRPVGNMLVTNTNHFYNVVPTTTRNLPKYYIVIEYDGIIYTGEYNPIWILSYKPDWIVGDNVRVRFDEKMKKMYVLRSDGEELKTKIIKRVRV